VRTPSSFTQKSHLLEYYYRMGRITQGLKKKIEATHYFDKTITTGRNEPYYYACNAALQLGIMYEKDGQKDKAKQYYQLCLSMNPSDYADSLHASAKAGLSRL
jgi:tetratricopeptide (TPR) repeat protein